MTLREKQSKFARMVADLLDKAHAMGFEITLGDAYRDPRLHGGVGIKKGYGHSKSCHKIRLAIDLNLFKDGAYIQDDTGHRQLGAWWVQQDPDCAWGGDFGDFNHYSFRHEGMR